MFLNIRVKNDPCIVRNEILQRKIYMAAAGENAGMS